MPVHCIAVRHTHQLTVYHHLYICLRLVWSLLIGTTLLFVDAFLIAAQQAGNFTGNMRSHSVFRTALYCCPL